MTERPTAVVFDVIETVFSLETMRRPLMDLGLDEHALEIWFVSGLRDAFALDATGDAQGFPSILRGALDQLCATRGLDASEKARSGVMASMKDLAPHPDVREAFAKLASAGIGTHMLSNGAAASTRHLLERNGLTDFVDGVFSVEEVGAFKPSRAVYDHAVESLGIPRERAMLVATHAWDCHGARAAGMAAGFVARGQVYPDIMRQPDVRGETLSECVDRVLALPA